jgi:hydroxyacylglutathione hydrolase
MKTWVTKNGYTIHKVLSGRSNAYLIFSYTSILVDTGKKSAFRRLCRKLDSQNMPVEKVKTLILTHTHFDHCQSAKEIKNRSGCQVIVSAEAAAYIQEGFTKLPAGTFFFTKLVSKLGSLIGDTAFGYDSFRPDLLVNGDLTLHDGNGVIRIIETKGHSHDSISILIDDEIAIVGDVMFGIFRNSIFPPFADDITKMVESWKILLQTDCKIFLPGHGGEIMRYRLEKELLKHTGKLKFNLNNVKL